MSSYHVPEKLNFFSQVPKLVAVPFVKNGKAIPLFLPLQRNL